MRTRILLVDDHEIVRAGLRTMLGTQDDIDVVGEADNGREALRCVDELRPEVVVMDVGMPDLNGIDATRQIMALAPSTAIIILSMHSDHRYVAEAFKAGAKGYLIKDCAFDELVIAVNAVASNRVYVSPSIAGWVVADFVRSLDNSSVLPAKAPSHRLSPREREVLQLVAEGKPTKQIAGLLHVSVKTIETHRRQIMQKADVTSVAELTKLAIREGLTDID